jgi:hypothetical protein
MQRPAQRRTLLFNCDLARQAAVHFYLAASFLLTENHHTVIFKIDFMETYVIEWRGQAVGTLSISGHDMWYLEGAFAGNDSEQAKTFTELAAQLNEKRVMEDFAKGTRVVLRNMENESAFSHAIVLRLHEDGMLGLRSVFADKAVEWLLKHVE